MNRKPFWPALLYVIIGLIFIVVGATLILPFASNSLTFPFTLFPFVWLGLIVLITGKSILLFLRGPGSGSRSGPARPIDGEYQSPYQKPPANLSSQAAPSERLRQLDTMRQAGLISEAEYAAKKDEILNDL